MRHSRYMQPLFGALGYLRCKVLSPDADGSAADWT